MTHHPRCDRLHVFPRACCPICTAIVFAEELRGDLARALMQERRRKPR